MSAFQEYQDFLSSIDNSKALTDSYGNLAWHVDCSATENAGDTLVEQFSDLDGTERTEKFYELCLSNAVMMDDCWIDFYPQLEITE